MKPEVFELNDSLTLDVIQTDKFKSDTLSVTFCVPADKLDSPVNTLLLSILKRGSVKFPTQGDINRRLDELYATTVSLKNLRLGDNQTLGFTAEMLDNTYVFDGTDVLDGTLEVICEMLFRPLMDGNGCFLQKYIDSEKQNICDVIASKVNDSRSFAMSRCREIMYEGEPYGASLYGSEEYVRSITPEMLRLRYRAILDTLHLYVSYVGNEETQKVIGKVQKYFGNIKSHATDIAATLVIPARGNVKKANESLCVSQGKLIIGCRSEINIKSEDYPSFIVFNEMLGGSPASKLFLGVREKMSLCYYCSSGIDGYKGSLFISSGIENDKRQVAESEILRQFSLLRSGDFSDFELDAAKKSLENSYLSLTDSPEAVSNFYTDKLIFGVNRTIDEYRAGFRKVSREDILKIAKKINVDTVYFLEGTATGDGDDDDEE